MDLVVKGRGVQVTDRFRRAAQSKLGKIARHVPRAIRLELELSSERNPRRDGVKHLDGTLAVPRHTFRARAEARDPLVALDQLVERLERQVKEHVDRRRKRVVNRLKSSRISQEGTG